MALANSMIDSIPYDLDLDDLPRIVQALSSAGYRGKEIDENLDYVLEVAKSLRVDWTGFLE